MIDLGQRAEPYQIALPYGLMVTVRPLTTAGMAAAQAAARRAVEAIERQVRERIEAGLVLDGLPDLSAEGERDGFYQAQLIRELAVRHITSWTGVELEGGPAPPTMPLLWAATQTNLGNALLALGEREEGTERLERAVSVYEQALLERTRELGPLDWAVTQYNLSNALLALGERDGSTERLERAVQVSRSALEVFRAEGATYYEQAARGNLARAEALVAERRAASSVD